ncbi:MAG: DUF4287 domain-containing protein [Oceanicaulis sp.]
MSAVDQALATQIANIEAKTGHPLDALKRAVLAADLAKHGEMVAFVKQTYGLGHGDANTLVHLARQSKSGPEAAPDDPLDAIYVDKKAHLRAAHERLIAAFETFGPYETAPKKGYVSLRRARQFAMLGPKTNIRFELGLNLKDDAAHPLMKAEPPGRMCQYIVSITNPDEIDAAMIDLARRAYDAAG